MSSFEKQSITHFIYSIEINCNQEKAWKLLTDVSNWHQWDTEVKEATLNGPFRVATQGTLIPKSGPTLPFEITELIEGQSYTFSTKMPVGHLVIQRKLSSKDNLTYFTDDIKFTGLLKYFFGLLLGGGFRKVLPGVMDNFKQLLEKKILMLPIFIPLITASIK